MDALLKLTINTLIYRGTLKLRDCRDASAASRFVVGILHVCIAT
jgi:hypothetical protein